LHELDVGKGWVPEDVDIADNETCSGCAILEESNDSDIVSRHDSIKDIMLSLHVRSVDGSVGKIDELLV
jgi:hypothetical protein